DAMHGWGRLGDAAIVEEIEVALRSPRAVVSLVGATSSDDRFVRRAAYRRLAHADVTRDTLALDGGGPYRSSAAPQFQWDIAAVAMRDEDPAIRAWAGRWLLAARDDVFLRFAEPLL